jgi:hypothetical protein
VAVVRFFRHPGLFTVIVGNLNRHDPDHPLSFFARSKDVYDTSFVLYHASPDVASLCRDIFFLVDQNFLCPSSEVARHPPKEKDTTFL